MGDHTSDPRAARRRHDVLEIPVVWVAFVLSLLLHVGALWLLMPRLLDRAHEARFGDGSRQIVADLRPVAPPSAPPPVPAPPTVIAAPVVPPVPPVTSPPRRAPEPAPKVAQPRKPPVRATPPPPPMVAERAPAAIPVPEPTPAPPEPAVVPNPRSAIAPAPRESDLSAYIEARRRARGESTSPENDAAPAQIAAESDIERRDRIVASNLGLNRTPSFGYDPDRAGGMFQITSLEYDYADFWFFGLNKAINRNTKQKIVVRKGDATDIRVAVVRRMIAIIRDHVSGDFTWISRQGPVIMSSRPTEIAALEAFILRDVFPDFR